jgi:hypothetical protein
VVAKGAPSAEAMLASILSELPGPDHEDDVALLVIRRP